MREFPEEIYTQVKVSLRSSYLESLKPSIFILLVFQRCLNNLRDSLRVCADYESDLCEVPHRMPGGRHGSGGGSGVHRARAWIHSQVKHTRSWSRQH